MKRFANLNREDRIGKVMAERRKDMALILEDLSEEQNISAILRTAESFGLGLVCIIHSDTKKPKLSLNVSSGASKWLDIEYFDKTSDCFKFIKEKGFKILATVVDPSAQNLWTLNLKDEKLAIVVGNEAKGLTEDTVNQADYSAYLPMFGLTESLNVSVAAALFLYDVVKQKEA